MDFGKISFRTSPDEAEYLQSLAHRYNASSTTELMHRFIADCMETNVGNVYRHRDGNYRPPDRQIERRDSDQTATRYRSSDSVDAAMTRFVLYDLHKENKHLQQINRQQQDVINHQRQQLDNLEQQLYAVNAIPSFWMLPMNKPTAYDPLTTMAAEAEKIARMSRVINDLG